MGLYQLIVLVQRLFQIYEVLIVVWCLMSWFPIRPGSLVDDLRGAIGTLVCPYLNLFRRLIPPLGGVDFSPVVAILILGVIERLVLTLLL
ncbi:YggT family protein [Thermophilibacter sp.]